MSGYDAPDEPRRIKSVQTASRIVSVVQRLSNPTLGDICAELDASKGTIHTYLATLEEEGFLMRDGQSYRLGLRFVTLSESVRNETQLYRAGKEEVDALAARTHEYAHLTLVQQGREVTIYESRGDDAVATDYHLRMRETPQHLHYSASGKALLSQFDNERVRSILDSEGLTEQTANTITDRDELFATLEQIRERGYAVNDEEEIRGMRSVGAPIRGVDGGVCGAVSVTAPTSRLTGDRFKTEVPKLVVETANLIELNLETAVYDRRR